MKKKLDLKIGLKEATPQPSETGSPQSEAGDRKNLFKKQSLAEQYSEATQNNELI